MRSGKQILAASGLVLCGSLFLHGQLEPWVQHMPSGRGIAALFRSVTMPGGTVPVLRPPAEARPALTAMIAAAPGDAALYRLRAREAELALDFNAAEIDWKACVDKASDPYSARIELADFYHHRLRSRDELAALTAAASAPDDPLQPASAQRGWQAYERMAKLIAEEALPESTADPVFRAWVVRYPKEAAAWRKLIDHLSSAGQFAAAENEIAAYGRNFHDEFEPVRMRAALEMQRGAPGAALATYDRAFQPLWPDEMRAAYFKLLAEQGQLREFTGRARTALAANPADLNATARLFHYFRSQNNVPAARRVLLEYRLAREGSRQPWTPAELQTAAQLFEWLPDVNEAARLYYALYSVAPAGGAHAERALYGLANLLLTAPDQPIQFGAGDLSFYKDIATVDPSPGFLNGILSLLLNWTGTRSQYETQNEKAGAYFHRAAASQLVALLDQRFPQSAYRAPLHAALVSAYAAYGDDASVIRFGREYLAAFPVGAARVAVAMQVSDALARGNRTTEEFALYDSLLRELAAKASGVPIGTAAPAAEPAARPEFPGMVVFNGQPAAPVATGARSGEYVQVLDKYLSRLAALKRPLEALRVYRAEIDRNPNDPGLYQRFAAHLEQNGMSRDVEDIYTRAIAKFADRSWYHKLARWYLRTRQASALEKISRDAVGVFSGSELEHYFTDVVQGHPDAALYLQLNLFAHDRFPEDLVFVHNLLSAYAKPETRDDAAAEKLLRQYWFYDPQLRSTLFERLSRQGRLTQELTAVRSGSDFATNPGALQFAMEAEAWLSHFEAAAPAARSLAAAFPGRRDLTAKASSLYRSLAAYDPRDTEIAVTLAGYGQRDNPRDVALLANMGDIYADRELFARARTYWERMPGAEPGKPEAYLDTATVYWDYYRYDDAVRWISAARRRFNNPALYAYQAGAIYEGKRDSAAAVREYIAGALNGEHAAANRLLRLLSRPSTRDLVDRGTQSAVAAHPTPEAIAVRISVLEALQRRQDLATLLQTRVETAATSTELTTLQEHARRLGFDRTEERAGERLAAIANDPVDKMRLTLERARLLESKKDIAGAARVIDTLYRDHPLILGVIRGAADFHVRNHQPDPAIELLLDAAGHARTGLAAQFTLEAARVATEAGQTDRARTLLGRLLAADPVRTEYLTAMADTYLRVKDDRGFRDFQLAAIQRLKQSPLTPAQRVERIAAVRRSLVPALDRLKDAAGAVDQYIEVLNTYAEDEALAKEAAAYAKAHGEAARLVAFYRKTATEAPLDYRWPVVLGRIETVTEDFATAIADYERAMKARPDRADVLEAKAGLEERLMRFDDALASYARLYELAYRDPHWLIKVAELRARTGRNAEAVSALRTAIIGRRNETAGADFDIAGQLDSWHLLPDAVSYAERGATLAGDELFKDGDDALVYARVMAHARRLEAVISRLGTNPGMDQQIQQVAGRIVAETYTPEEKLRLEQALNAEGARRGAARDSLLLPFVTSAELVELEVRWRQEGMAAQFQQIDSQFTALQSERGMYAELGGQLEAYAAKYPGRSVESGALAQAAQAFLAEGDQQAELRVMRKALARNALSGALLDRYLGLLAAYHRDQLLDVARSNSPAAIRNRAVQFAIAADAPWFAYSAVRARGNRLPPVWTSAFTALAGLYLGDHAPGIDRAFQAALDTRTIGERLQVPGKPDSVILGPVWFYYGARYGDYLAAAGSSEAEAWLPASLEASPGNPDAYLALGDSYADARQSAKAIAEFEHVLELDSDRGDAHDRVACVLWSEGRRAEATARWKTAFDTFLQIQSRGVRVPEPFWGRVARTFTDIGERHSIDLLRPEIAHLLGDYYQRNNQYRLDELLRSAARASITSGAGTDWLVELGKAMGNPEMMLDAVMRVPDLTAAQRISVQRDLAVVRAKQVESNFGDQRRYAETLAVQARWQLVRLLLDAGDVKAAAAEWSLIPVELIPGFDQSVEIRLAARTGTLGALLERYRSTPAAAPGAEILQRGAVDLRRGGDEASARTVLEFLYERELSAGRLIAANFLGLAEVKLQRSDAAGALALLNRMALVADDPFDTLLPAAELLAKYAKTKDAADFLRRRIQAVPWDSDAKARLARTLPAGAAERAQLLAAAINDSQAAYRVRADAARAAVPGPAVAAAGAPSSRYCLRRASARRRLPNRTRWKHAWKPRAPRPCRRRSFASGARRWRSRPQMRAPGAAPLSRRLCCAATVSRWRFIRRNRVRSSDSIPECRSTVAIAVAEFIPSTARERPPKSPRQILRSRSRYPPPRSAWTISRWPSAIFVPRSTAQRRRSAHR